MKCVIFVNSLFGLISAIQIREGIYQDCVFDIIVSDIDPKLKRVYDNRVLEEKFSNVIFVSHKNQKKFDKLVFFLSPELYIKRILGNNIKFYTDVFFWNPTLLLHSYLIYLNRNHQHYNLHLYGDAIGSYVTECPFDNSPFNNRLLNILLKFVSGFCNVEEMSYDYYVFASKYISFSPKHRIIEIPSVKKDMTEYYNRLFNYDERIHIFQRIIFMDKQHDDMFDEFDYGLSIINELIRSWKNESVIVKPHPRQDLQIYTKNNIRTLRLDNPWELYCLNNDISDKVIISYGSSALYLPYIFNCKQKYIAINIKADSRFERIYSKEYNAFIDKFKYNNSNFYEVDDIAQLIGILNRIFDEQRGYLNKHGQKNYNASK